MPYILLIACLALIPWLAWADPIRESAGRLETNPDCALRLAESLNDRPNYLPSTAAVAASILAEAGQIDAAQRLIPIVEDAWRRRERCCSFLNCRPLHPKRKSPTLFGPCRSTPTHEGLHHPRRKYRNLRLTTFAR